MSTTVFPTGDPVECPYCHGEDLVWIDPPPRNGYRRVTCVDCEADALLPPDGEQLWTSGRVRRLCNALEADAEERTRLALVR